MSHAVKLTKTTVNEIRFLGSVRSSGSQSVCLSGTSLSKALNLYLSLTGLSQIQIGLRSVSGQSQVSVRSV